MERFHGLYDPGADSPVLRRAREARLPVCFDKPAAGFYLADVNGRLTLCRGGEVQARGIDADFDSADVRRRVAAGKRTALARALGLHRNTGMQVLDATCGLGRDSAVLAALGATVTAIERHPALYALLADALHRIEPKPAGWRGRWRALHHADAAAWLAATWPDAPAAARYDAIYIDPMFASPRRKARPQRPLQWLHELVGTDDDTAALLSRARQRAKRVVVKCHARAAPLAPPDHQVAGRALRFDVYFNAANEFR